MPGLQGRPPEARVAWRSRSAGCNICGAHRRMSIRDRLAFVDELDLSERERHDRRAHAEGDPGPAAVPGGRGAGLPDARPGLGHAGRRRGPADPAGHPDRQRPGRGAVHPRRALDRPAPAGQPPADRHADPAARPGQHADRRRARRGHDPRPPTTWSTSARARASWAARSCTRATSRACCDDAGSITGAYLSGRRSIPTPQVRRPPRRPVAEDRGGAGAQPEGRRRGRSRSGRSSASPGVSGSGKSTLVEDVLHRALQAKVNRSRVAARQAQAHRRAGSRSTRSSTSTSRRSGGRRGPTRPRTSGCSTTSATLFAQVPEARVRGYQPGRFSLQRPRAGGARTAPATARSRSRCTSCPTSTSRARSARASGTTGRRSR